LKLEIRLHLGDITKLPVDAIVNAANEKLLAGSGVCGAIHKAAGPELEKECLQIGCCATGDAVMTRAYNLPAKYVIHTVGPKYLEAGTKAPELLRSCYEKSLKLADQRDLTSISFPAISTGIFGYPIHEATRIAFETVITFKPQRNLNTVYFVCFSKRDHQIYQALATEFGVNLKQ